MFTMEIKILIQFDAKSINKRFFSNCFFREEKRVINL